MSRTRAAAAARVAGGVEHRDAAGERLEVVAQHGQLVLVLRDRRAVGALAPLDDDVGDHVERPRPRVHLLRDDLVLVRPAHREAQARRAPQPGAAHLRPRDDVAGCLGVLLERRADPRGVGGCRDPRLHDARRVAAADVGAQPHVGADGEVAAAGRERCRRAARARAGSGGRRRRGRPTNGVSTRSRPVLRAAPRPALRGVVHDAEPRIGRRGGVEDRAGVVGRRVVDEDRRPSPRASARAASRARPPPTVRRRSRAR